LFVLGCRRWRESEEQALTAAAAWRSERDALTEVRDRSASRCRELEEAAEAARQRAAALAVQVQAHEADVARADALRAASQRERDAEAHRRREVEAAVGGRADALAAQLSVATSALARLQASTRLKLLAGRLVASTTARLFAAWRVHAHRQRRMKSSAALCVTCCLCGVAAPCRVPVSFVVNAASL
jgi:hypothetical protein